MGYIFIILYCLSPLILIPWVISNSIKLKDYKNKSNHLENFIVKLLSANRISSDEVKKETFMSINIDTGINLYEAPVPEVPTLSAEVKEYNAYPNPPPINNKAVSLEKEKISSISIVLILGVIFIILSAGVFLTTTWNSLSGTLRILVIFSLSILFFAVSVLSEKKLSLKRTGMAFYAIGSALLPLTILAIGLFNLLGRWLSVDGGGWFLLIAAAFFSLLIVSIIGISKYQSKIYSIVALTSFSCMIFSFCKFIAGSNILLYILLLSSYGFLFICFNKKMKSYLSNTKKYSSISKIIETFSVVNLILITIFVYPTSFLKVSDLSTVIANLLILLAYIILALQEKESFKYKNEIPLSILTLTIQLSRLICQNLNLAYNYYGFFITALIIAVSFFIFRFTKVLRTHVTDITFISILTVCTIRLNLNFDFLFVPPVYFGLISSLLLVIAVITLILEQPENKITRIMQYALPFTIALLTWGQLIPMRTFFPYFSADNVTEIMFLIYYLFIITTTIILTVMSDRCQFAKRLSSCFALSTILCGYILKLVYWDNSKAPYIWVLTIFLIFKTVMAERNKNEKSAKTYCVISLVTIIISSISHNLDTSSFIILSRLSLSICFIFIIYLILNKNKIELYCLDILKKFVILALPISTVIMSFSYTNTYSINIDVSAFLFCIVMISISYFSGHLRNTNYLSIIPALAFYFVSSKLIDDLFINKPNIKMLMYLIIFIALAISGRIVYKKIKNIDKNSKVYFDWFTIVSVISPVVMCYQNRDIWQFVGWLTFAVYSLLYFKRVEEINKNKSVITITAIFLCIAYWFQPFINIPRIIEKEFNMFPILLFCIALKFIWKERNKSIDNFNFSVAVICITSLGKDAMFSGTLNNLISFLLITLIILILSFIFKRKKWFMMSALCLAISTVYLTKELWLSISWWVYLLIIGILLIFLAGFNEYYKQNNYTLKEKCNSFVKRLSHDWQW